MILNEETKTLGLELSDSDIINMDDVSGDITVKFIDNVSLGDIVEIHFKEDEDNVFHRYKVTFIDGPDAVTSLQWIEMTDKTLNEANPFKAIKDKIHPDQATQLAKSHKKAIKADKKLNKKATDLYRRDVEDGKNWDFYLQMDDGNHIKKPLKYNDVMSMYKSNNLKPWIVNAVVVADGFIVRRGKEDLDETGTRFSNTTSEVRPAYAQEWTDEDVKEFKDIVKESKKLKEIVDLSRPKKSTKKTKLSKTTSDDRNGSQDNSKEVSIKNISKKLKDISSMTGMQITRNGRPLKSAEIGSLSPEEYPSLKVVAGETQLDLDKWIKTAQAINLLTEAFSYNCKLNESPEIRLSDSDLVDPAKIDFKELGRAAVEKENQEKLATIELKKKAELRTKYAEAPEKLDAALHSNMLVTDTLEVLHDILVPPQGAADSAAGELVRAMMRILYRDSNDGDKFFEGYGIETCGSSAEYLFDNGFSEDIQNIVEHAWQLSEDDDKYTDALYNLTDKVVKHINNNTELFFTPNEEDSRDYSIDYISENQPRYEFELYGSDDIDILVDKGVLTSWDLTKYVEGQLEWESEYRDAEVANPWSHHDTSVTVVNLTRDGYERLKNAFEHNPEEWWEDLTSEYADDLADSDYDDDYEEE